MVSNTASSSPIFVIADHQTRWSLRMLSEPKAARCAATVAWSVIAGSSGIFTSLRLNSQILASGLGSRSASSAAIFKFVMLAKPLGFALDEAQHLKV